MPLLDGLRGIAALAVVFHHEPVLYGAQGLFTKAYLAVDFFFMLSGLVLTLAFEQKFAQNGHHALSADNFLLQRLGRLWPVLAVGVLIGAAGHWWMGATTNLPVLTLTGLLLLPVLQGRGGIYQLDGPQWSVTFEIIANYAHARGLWRLGLGALAAFVVAMGALLAGLAVHFGSLAMGDVVGNWWGGFARVGFSYGLGMLMARMLATRGVGHRTRWLWLAALPVPLVLFGANWSPLGWLATDLIAVFLIFPPTLWFAARVRIAGPVALGAGWLGRLSYPIYAIHGPILYWGVQIAHRYPAMLMPIRLGAIAVTFATAALIAISPLAHGIPLRRKG